MSDAILKSKKVSSGLWVASERTEKVSNRGPGGQFTALEQGIDFAPGR